GFSVKAGETFSVIAKATTDSAVKVQWTIGDVTEEATDLTAIDDVMVATRTLESGLTEGTTITATFLDAEGIAIQDEEGNKYFVSALFNVTPQDETEDGKYVAKIGETKYTDIDVAIAEADDGDTIILLADVAATRTFYKSLTFTGGKTLSMDVYGWRYNGDLIFDGANFNINSNGNSPVANNGEAGRWFTMVLGGSITARNGANITFTFDSASGTNCAIYAGKGGVTINAETGSTFSIYGKNTTGVNGQGIQLDSTANTGIFVTGRSNFLIDGTNRGYVNSPTIYVEKSTFTVQNCTSNASNGGKFTAIDSEINFLNNTGHGLSATTLDISDESKVNCNHNGYYGVTVSSSISMDGTSTLIANENGWGYTGGALRIANSLAKGSFAKGAVVQLKDNVRNALENYGTCTFEDGVDLQIINNKEPNNGAGIYNGSVGEISFPANAVIMNNTAGKTGGGICSKGGTVTIPGSVKLYNNHAGTAGDDIYNAEGATITFGAVGDDWYLDGDEDNLDCNGVSHHIDGWYEDGASENGTRWFADTVEKDKQYIIKQDAVTLTGSSTLYALKAAHGLVDLDGYIFGDENKDNIYDNADKLINGEVKLFAKDNSDTLIAVTTSSAGYFEFKDLPYGDYVVQITLDEESSKLYNAICGISDAETGNQLNQDSRIEVELQGNKTVYAGFKLDTGAIEGYIFVDNNKDNIYVAETDEALKNVTVKLYRLNNDDNTYTKADSATTDALGYYKFDNLIPGERYFVCVDRPAGYNTNCAYAYSANQINGDRFSTSDVVTGENNAPLYCSDIIAIEANTVERANAGFYATSTPPGGDGGGGSTTYTDRTVTKLWKNDDAANRPSSITINVLNNGEVSSQITLSEANGWTYSWKTSSGNWDVEEVNVPAGYTSSVSQSGNDFTITNTYTGIVPEEPITDPEVPTTEPTTPEEPITDPDVPTTDVPGTPVEPIAEPEVPLGDAPKTGDSSNAVPFAALALVAGAGLVIARRKFN
ncbi:MAG: SdrD B-like domain-containing protein, partial [Peptococcaceae bacterium]